MTSMTFSIGPVQVQGVGVLAPLASVSDAPFRQICLEQGCALAVTEMVASEALVRGVGKIMDRMVRAEGEKTLVVQLFGADPGTMARAAAIAVERSGANVIDINMGCPVRKILGVGAGVALMRDPDRATAIVREVVRVCAPRVPVTVKMRAGWDDQSVTAGELARRVEDAGAAAIAIHARTKEQVHAGASRWDVIAAVKAAVCIPVLGNGGVRSVRDAQAMMERTGCDAVMVGRGALGNPWIFAGIAQGQEVTPGWDERLRVIRRHLDLHVRFAGDAAAAREMRKHLGWYLRGLPGSAMVRAALQRMKTPGDVREAVDAFDRALRSGRVRPGAGDFGSPAGS